MGVQIRVTGAAVPMGKRRRDQAADVHLPDPVRPLPGEQSLLLQERGARRGRRPGGPVRSARRPAGRRPPTALTPTSPGRTSNRSRRPSAPAAGNASRSSRPPPGICWWPAMLGGEQLPRHLGPYPGPLGRRNRPVRRQPGLLVERGDPLRHLNPKPGRFGVDDLERHAQPGRLRTFASVRSASRSCSNRCCRQRDAFPPRTGPASARRSPRPRVQAIDAGQARADPRPRALASFGVVGGQPDVALRGGIQRCDLPGQIVVPRTGGELLNAHRHSPPKALTARRRSAASRSRAKGVLKLDSSEIGGGT